VEDFHSIKDGDIYIIIAHSQGYAIKKVVKKLENNSLTLKSLNPLYPEYEVNLKEINEIWKFKGYFSDHLPTMSNPFTGEEQLDKMKEVKSKTMTKTSF
jgi:hypothetical protein